MNLRKILMLTLLAGLASGCAGENRPPLADTWGQSVRMAVENQKLDPAAGGTRPVVGLDGVYAKGALDAYRKSSEPDPNAGKNPEKPIEAMLAKGVK